ncbi:vitelline membrane outer layer protein 1 homolog [Mercenaria mercenaria]|uniref:vitelline membrane outer layer protein 1 homolog n=1 Tax=Mercenaria mercenaria TaxID=6596 RepID=UPI00234F0B90|nr:vitelline membrane outer layer protein 1 homolog [Mercenaria mercenaria]
MVFQNLSVNNEGKWGSLRNAEFCPEGSYASGYDMKIDPYRGAWMKYDDTVLNGIKLFCESQDGQLVHNITSDVGPWGDWVGAVSCKHLNGSKFYLTAFDLQVEPPDIREPGLVRQGILKDDTAANFVKFKCRDRGGKFQSYELAKDPGHGEFGLYGSWSEECLFGTAICGLATKIEEDAWDNSALNDVIFYCCH